MWPFKKKTVQEPMTSATFETIICIPGNWNSWDELILEIVAATNGEYLAAGNILMHAGNNKHYTIEFFRTGRQDESFLQICGHDYGGNRALSG